MCLLAVLSRVHPDFPLIIAANRDELPRPAVVARDAPSSLDWTAGGRPGMRQLERGLHVLENQPIDAPSLTAAWTRAALAGVERLGEAALAQRLGEVLRSHEVPALDGASA